MKRLLGTLVTCIIFVTSAFCVAAQSWNAGLCSTKPQEPDCSFFVRYKNATIYERPNTESNIVGTLQWTSIAQIDWLRLSAAPQGWFPTYTILARPDGGSINVPQGWVQIKNLIRQADFREVVGCWPIASLEYETGDAVFHAKFTVSGRAQIASNSPINRVPVFFVDDLVLIHIPKAPPMIFGFDVKTREIGFNYPNDLERIKDSKRLIQFFSDKKLKNCGSMLKLKN